MGMIGSGLKVRTTEIKNLSSGGGMALMPVLETEKHSCLGPARHHIIRKKITTEWIGDEMAEDDPGKPMPSSNVHKAECRALIVSDAKKSCASQYRK
jgi:hypothetical protein